MDNKALKRQIIAFYFLVALYACFFATGNWYFLWKLYLTNKGIGLVDAASFAAGFFMQIPSGAIADLFGRRKTIIFAAIVMAIGYSITGFAISGGLILIGYLIYSVGASFYSGADESLMYDNLKKYGQEDQWKKIVTNKYIITISAALSATILGGLLFGISVRLPSIVRGVFFLLMLAPAIFLPENFGKKSSEKVKFKEYLQHIKDGMKQIMIPGVLKVVPLVAVIGGVLTTMYVGGILRPLLFVKAGYGGQSQSYFIGIAGIITALALMIYKKYLSHVSSLFIIWVIGFITLFSFFVLNVLPSNYWLLFLIIIQMMQGLYTPVTSDIINHQVSSKHRATTLSTLQLIQSLPYIVLAPLVGALADSSHYQLIIGGITAIVFLGIVISFFLQVKSKES